MIYLTVTHLPRTIILMFLEKVITYTFPCKSLTACTILSLLTTKYFQAFSDYQTDRGKGIEYDWHLCT